MEWQTLLSVFVRYGLNKAKLIYYTILIERVGNNMEKNRLIKTALCMVLAFAMTFAPIFSSYAMIVNAAGTTGEQQVTETQEPAAAEEAAPSDEGTQAEKPQPAADSTENKEAAEAPSVTTEKAAPEQAAEKAEAAPEQAEAPKTDAEPEKAEAEPAKEEEKATKTEYVWKDDKVKVTAKLSDASAIPDDAKLVATAIGKDSAAYNYDAYMEALNNSSDSRCTDKNTLLYDVAFIKDGKEIQPEAGSVSVTFEFLDKQLSDSIGAEKAADVNVLHLPLADDVKDKYNTTADATDIDAGDINVEEVTETGNDLKVSVKKEKVAFELESFSGVAFYAPEEETPLEGCNIVVRFEDVDGNPVKCK